MGGIIPVPAVRATLGITTGGVDFLGDRDLLRFGKGPWEEESSLNSSSGCDGSAPGPASPRTTSPFSTVPKSWGNRQRHFSALTDRRRLHRRPPGMGEPRPAWTALCVQVKQEAQPSNDPSGPHFRSHSRFVFHEMCARNSPGALAMARRPPHASVVHKGAARNNLWGRRSGGAQPTVSPRPVDSPHTT